MKLAENTSELYRAVVRIDTPAYTTAWGVERPPASETFVVGPHATAEETARHVRDETAWFPDHATVTVRVQRAETDWKDTP